MKQYGFTLFEMLVVVAIISILVAIAVPSYRTYMRRAHYTEIVQATAPYKIGVEECYQISNNLDNCNAGSNGVPAVVDADSEHSMIAKITVEKGVITITPKNKYGITAEDNYQLSPTIANDSLVWETSGGGVEAGYAN